MKRFYLPGLAVMLRVLLLPLGAQELLPMPDTHAVMPAIFKVHVVAYRYDYQQPWQAGGSTSGSGSAFLIGDGMLLTCGHVVADAISIEVQPNGSAERHPAKVRFMGYDADLAILELEDPSLLEGLPALEIEAEASELGDEVFAIGFPMGGTRLSLTRGIVSRLDHAVYAFSGVDQRLVMQIDAAINPGNSGGPVVNRENRVVGVAFQGIAQGQGLGYAVPVPVIRHFLTDVRKPPYHGVPQLHLQTFELRNPRLRAQRGVEQPGIGAVVTAVSPLCTSAPYIQPGDVLLSIENVPIQQDGTILLGNNNLPFWELVERKQWGESLTLELLRDGNTHSVTFPLTPDPHPFLFRRIYDRAPEYFLTAGLAFVPITRNHIMTLGGSSNDSLIPVFYYFQQARFDASVAQREHLITLAAILPHRVNAHAGDFENQILKRVNDQDIRTMADLPRALASPIDGYHILAFEALPMPLILEAEPLAEANAEIQQRYGITRSYTIHALDAPEAPLDEEGNPTKGL